MQGEAYVDMCEVYSALVGVAMDHATQAEGAEILRVRSDFPCRFLEAAECAVGLEETLRVDHPARGRIDWDGARRGYELLRDGDVQVIQEKSYDA
ncbi:hypothetical protein ACFL0V_03530 [Nanoarchaeota archaeon]